MSKVLGRLNALQSFFLILAAGLVGCCSFASLVIASAPFEDDFDSYSTGAINGAGGWSAYNAGGNVSTEQSYSSPNSLKVLGTAIILKDGGLTASGEWYFRIYIPSGQAASTCSIRQVKYSPYANAEIEVTQDGAIRDMYSNLAGMATLDAWNTVGTKWSSGSYQLEVNGGAWTAAQSMGGGTDIISFDIRNAASNLVFYVDDIAESLAPPVIAGYNPVLTPTTPPRNVSTVVDLDNLAMSGLLEIPTANSWIWDHLIVKFYKQNSIIPARVFSFALGDLSAGQSTNYSATTTLPYTISGNNFYKVQYSLTGHKYAGSVINNPTIAWPLLTIPPDDTWVSDNAGTPPASQIVQSILPTQDALEGCGAYSGIDAVVCNLKNFIAGAFLPTNDAIDQLNSTMDGFKTKFPMNYANAITETLTTIGAGVSDTAGFNFTLYGHSGTVDTSIFSKDLGSGVTVGGTIKLILTFLVLVVFLIWGINYMHRIFR